MTAVSGASSQEVVYNFALLTFALEQTQINTNYAREGGSIPFVEYRFCVVRNERGRYEICFQQVFVDVRYTSRIHLRDMGHRSFCASDFDPLGDKGTRIQRKFLECVQKDFVDWQGITWAQTLKQTLIVNYISQGIHAKQKQWKIAPPVSVHKS